MAWNSIGQQDNFEWMNSHLFENAEENMQSKAEATPIQVFILQTWQPNFCRTNSEVIIVFFN